MRRLFSLVTAGVLAGCATITPPPPALTAGDHYVAIGSSFAAGAGVPPLATDRPERCGASEASYARVLAARLRLDLTDVSCGGATTAHVLGPWNELPPQIDAVRSDTRLVTITIGGNDLNYMGVMFTASCHAGIGREWLANPETGLCQPVPVPSEAAYRQVEDDLARIFAEIGRRAPSAKVILVQYVTLDPASPCPAAAISDEHAEIARTVAHRLAQASERAAALTGAEVLPIDRMSVGHTPCDANPWATGLSNDYDMAQGAPWHPNAAGHAAIAAALEAVLTPN